MAKISDNTIFERRPMQNSQQLPITMSDFITSSTAINKHFPLNYPYNIYNNEAWDASPPLLEGLEEEKRPCSCNKICWWYPNQDSVPAEFLEASSMHGLKYVSQPKRHIIERLFWLGSFIACVVAAALMISEIWNRYYENPVIVTFKPTELEVETIPFPAVTICNMNPFKRSKVFEFQQKYREGATEAERKQALDALRVINGLCSAQPSFLKTLKFATKRGEMMFPEAKDSPSAEMEKNLTQFLLQNTQPCNELLRFCVWEQETIDCDKLFKPILSDYGKCCTFNMLPQELMEYNHTSSSSQNNGASSVTKAEMDDWAKWEYGDGYTVPTDLKYPYRQRRAGMIDGLSVLVDPDIQNGFCSSSDSEGIKVLFHVPLEFPRVADLGSIVGVDREVFMEVNPDLTIADEGIESYAHEKRKCYFGREFQLNYYRPYTRSNCLEECWSDILFKNCSCVLYYAPRNATTNVCSSNPISSDYKFVKDNERRFLGRLHKICAQCQYSCNDLSYTSEVTFATLQSNDILWADGINGTKVDWMSHHISVLHVFMGSDTVVPKLRQKLYQTVDLIANTGGLLGLSIGFSVLSAVEIVYFATMRICCKRIRKSSRYGPSESNPENKQCIFHQNRSNNNPSCTCHGRNDKIFPQMNRTNVAFSNNNTKWTI